MTPTAFEKLRCRLYLEAVLGRLPGLCALSARARAAAARRTFSIRLRTVSGLAVAHRFENGRCRLVDARACSPDVDLVFIREKQANAFLATGSGYPPLPLRGWYKVECLRAFRAVTDELQRVLDAATPQSAGEPEVRLLLETILESVRILHEADPATRRQAGTGPRGILHITPGPGARPCWLSIQAESIRWGEDSPPAPPDVYLSFADFGVALAALRDKLDNMAEVGRGRIVVRGSIPLADQAGVLMSRVGHFLDN